MSTPATSARVAPKALRALLGDDDGPPQGVQLLKRLCALVVKPRIYLTRLQEESDSTAGALIVRLHSVAPSTNLPTYGVAA